MVVRDRRLRSVEHSSDNDDRWWERGKAKWDYVCTENTVEVARPGKHTIWGKAKLRGLARR